MIWKYNHLREYIKLVQQFPLAPIRSRSQHGQAMQVLHDLMLKSKMSSAENDYFDVLSDLIQKYESQTTSTNAVTPQQALEFLMEQNGIGQADVSRITNVHPPHISEFFAGRRNIPKHAAAKLGGLFKVDPSIFLPKVSPAETTDEFMYEVGSIVCESTASDLQKLIHKTSGSNEYRASSMKPSTKKASSGQKRTGQKTTSKIKSKRSRNKTKATRTSKRA
jgi:antitoxin component HigA of HigAB toxin-antitoxin module